ncbi:hypothetical protein BO82DRAFT_157908 [Aspergillus uvarum CBS 121591]|uniref:Uncharacterized protein n=1 Tax=Aspergillus uvarum CBS 121591 TaxID=1448315 RepID=A0A319BZV9_9EURO|nr:hypothetical protein BO82DRAFT_157908 [Aspergillus uvarum CBS 121591]PYH78325.1 hypothetical protein BO82DRAFT_157908 [Aspergillus uvarum CBS 121591]
MQVRDSEEWQRRPELILVMERPLSILPIVRWTKQQRGGRLLSTSLGYVLYLFSGYREECQDHTAAGSGAIFNHPA